MQFLLADWTASAKFKICEQVITFYSRKSKPVPDEHQPMLDFYNRNAPLMPALRSKQWSGTHPERWTSRSLLDDCLVADSLEGPLIQNEMEMTLSEFYQT